MSAAIHGRPGGDRPSWRQLGAGLGDIIMDRISIIGGTTLLIMVSVALETMRQIEANLLMKQYGN